MFGLVEEKILIIIWKISIGRDDYQIKLDADRETTINKKGSIQIYVRKFNQNDLVFFTTVFGRRPGPRLHLRMNEPKFKKIQSSKCPAEIARTQMPKGNAKHTQVNRLLLGFCFFELAAKAISALEWTQPSGEHALLSLRLNILRSMNKLCVSTCLDTNPQHHQI